MSNNYYDDFLLGEENEQGLESIEVDKGLEWIKLHPTAEKAYNAINSLREEKLRYIRGHPNKKSYEVKKHWTINKAEVGRRIGKESQPLFNSNTFSGELTKYFDKINNELRDAQKERIKKPNKGYQHKSKKELKKRTIKLTKENEKLLQNTCEELYGRMLNDMPLDVKRKLGLN